MSKERSASKISLQSLDDLFKSSEITGDDKVMYLNLNLLNPYSNHHFKVVDDDKMTALESSISEEGVINPITVRKMGDKYEILSGHRRVRACEKCNISQIPAIVKELDDVKAELYVIEANIQRDKKLPSELAFCLKRECELRKHSGIKGEDNTDIILVPILFSSYSNAFTSEWSTFSTQPLRAISRIYSLTEDILQSFMLLISDAFSISVSLKCISIFLNL